VKAKKRRFPEGKGSPRKGCSLSEKRGAGREEKKGKKWGGRKK